MEPSEAGLFEVLSEQEVKIKMMRKSKTIFERIEESPVGIIQNLRYYTKVSYKNSYKE